MNLRLLMGRFTTWPDDALSRVAENFVRSMNLASGPVKASSDSDTEPVEENTLDDDDADQVAETKLTTLEFSLVEMVMQFNTSIVDASAQYVQT